MTTLLSRKNHLPLVFLCLIICTIWMPVMSQDRFPKPEFETDYQQPLTTTPEPRAPEFAYLDIILLIIALSLASYFAIKKRSRSHIFVLMLLSLIYFGFIRK